MECPNCKYEMAEILYGDYVIYPNGLLETAIRKKRKYLGGCVVRDEKWHCYNCEKDK